MVNSDKGHLFFWRTSDFRPVRTLFALTAAGIILFLLITRVPLPFSEAMQIREGAKAQRIANSQNLKPVIVVPADRLTASGITTHFSYNDPLNAASAVSQIIDKSVSEKSDQLLKSYKSALTPHEIQYPEIPYTLPKTQALKSISAELPQRNIEFTPSAPKAAPEFILQAAIKPNIDLPPLPSNELDGNHQKVTYQISVSPLGTLLYTLPLDLNYQNKPLENWINTLTFPVTKSPATYTLSFELRRK